MVRTIARTPVRVAWVVGTALVMLLCFADQSAAQVDAPKPRVRSLLKAGIDSNKRGDFEAASKYYQMVESGKADLNPTEQKDFRVLVEQNNLALQGRRDGTVQIQLSLNYLEKGNTDQAAKLLRQVGTNPYLSPADKESLRALNERLRVATVRTVSEAKMMSEPVNKDMKSLLTAARGALSRGELELAEALCSQADKVGYTIPTIFHPWSDTPSRVRRDIQVARAKLTQPLIPEAPVVVQEKRDSGPFAFVKGLFGMKQKEDPAPAQRIDPKTPSPGVIAKGSEKPTPKNTDPTHHATAYPPVTGTIPGKDFTPPKTTDIQTASVGGGTADKTRAIQLINDGYAALERGDTAAAQKLALQAKALRPDLAWWERNPDRLLSDIERQTGRAGVAAAPGKGTPAEARTLLKDARTLLGQNRFEEAEKLVVQAAGITSTRWGLFEDNPDKVRGDILKAKSRRDRDEAGKLLVEARALYQSGNYHEAKVKAWQAQKLHGAYSIWDLGDRPQKLLEEIHRAELKFSPNPAPKTEPGSSLLRPNPTAPSTIAKTVTPGAPASVASINRQKAIVLLSEARMLQKRGHLALARDKAVEAKKLGVVFSPEEDNPDAALWSLNALCDANVQAYMKRAIDTVMNNPTDGERFKKAQSDLESAKQLALSFRHDMAAVEQKMLWLQQSALASGAAPLGPTTPPAMMPAPTGMALAGKDKLDKARLEMRSGNTLVARRLAEEAYNPAYGVQEEALMVLRSIDAEEGNQVRLGAERNARAGIDAFVRKDYRMASSVLAAIDMRLLPPELYGQVREVLRAPELIGGGESRVPAGKDSKEPGKLDIVAASATDIRDTSDDKFRAMEKIQFQQMRERTLVTLSNAHDLMTRGMGDKALDLLNDQLSQLSNASMEPELSAPLKRQIDFRIQQYRTLQAQQAIEGHTRIVKASNPEHDRMKAIAKHQEKAKEKLDQYRSLMKEGRYKEAQTAALQAQELDPDNVAAQAAVQIAETQKNIKNWESAKKKNEKGFLDELSNDYGDWATSGKPYVLNKEALERSKKRGYGAGLATMGKTGFQRAVEEKLHHPVNVKFVNTPLSQVLEILRTEAGGVNMIADRKALLEESVSLDQPISESLENLSLKSALNIILGQAKLTYVIKDDYISITTPSQAKGRMKQVVHPVADLVIPVENHATNSVNNMQDALMRHISSQSGMMFQSPTPYTPPAGLPQGTPASSYSSGLGSAFASGGPPSAGTGGFNVNKSNAHTIEDMLINLITNTVAQDSWNSMGGPGTVQYYPLGMALVINQSQEVQEEVLALLQALRRLQDLEVAIEMKLVNVSEAFFERMGMDFDVNLRTGTSRREPDLLSGNFTPFGFVNRSNDRLGLVSGLTPAGTLTPDLNIPLRNSSFDFSVPPFGGYPGTLGSTGGLALGLAFLSDIQVFMFMEAAQGDRRTQVMQAPKITVFNGQTANISVQDQQFFLLGVNLQQAGPQLFFQPQNTPIPLGVNLQVTPVISADRRFVRLNLTPQMTNLASATVPLIPVQIPVPQLFEGPGGGITTGNQPVIFQMFFQQPTFSQILVNTTVNVPDGGTVLLGGLKTMSESRNEFGPPILSKIPYINRLFKNVGYGREVSSLMIMVTPRIIINEEEEAIFLGQLEPIERE